MATVPSSPAPASDLVRTDETLPGGAADGIVGASRPAPDGTNAGWSPLVLRLPVELDVAVPVRGFKVRHLVALVKGSVIESQWEHAEDVPLATRGAQLAWCEFEVIETHLAVRLTRLA